MKKNLGVLGKSSCLSNAKVDTLDNRTKESEKWQVTNNGKPRTFMMRKETCMVS